MKITKKNLPGFLGAALSRTCLELYPAICIEGIWAMGQQHLHMRR